MLVGHSKNWSLFAAEVGLVQIHYQTYRWIYVILNLRSKLWPSSLSKLLIHGSLSKKHPENIIIFLKLIILVSISLRILWPGLLDFWSKSIIVLSFFWIDEYGVGVWYMIECILCICVMWGVYLLFDFYLDGIEVRVLYMLFWFRISWQFWVGWVFNSSLFCWGRRQFILSSKFISYRPWLC